MYGHSYALTLPICATSAQLRTGCVPSRNPRLANKHLPPLRRGIIPTSPCLPATYAVPCVLLPPLQGHGFVGFAANLVHLPPHLLEVVVPVSLARHGSREPLTRAVGGV